jgi:hypothetical protein
MPKKTHAPAMKPHSGTHYFQRAPTVKKGNEGIEALVRLGIIWPKNLRYQGAVK